MNSVQSLKPKCQRKPIPGSSVLDFLFLKLSWAQASAMNSFQDMDGYDSIQQHTIFRHGERTVDPSTLYPKDPYINEKYYPYGVGQLTNGCIQLKQFKY
ncbi:hypothetical protein NQ318_006409 [Aromia moschata]|uniref:Acid phosphatase n=1 Tax=Aromia moschata TaxID=1265417 RepID=A0AAV8YI04_9CUCU|nr:hypothetical protein NQ318_006409 [Aromia moschata]